MRKTKELIEENNQKRKLLSDDNLKLYEDFLVYIRTDLRIAEQESEELLIELLDHLLEAQHAGRNGKELFGNDPKAYAEELIEGLPREKKRKTIPFITSILLNLFGWGAVILAIVHLVFPRFMDVKEVLSLGSLMSSIFPLILITSIGTKVILTLVRSTLFKEEKQHKKAYWKAGLFGGGSFAIILLITWLTPDFGPNILVAWWIYLMIGLGFILSGKVIQKAFHTH
ncbi:DUF1129 family protein [Bacillus sp. THAF10]|uniref:DUF1129 family protein n=1 Tax=Bacillus sp. THAF10 TaxID=2587848 RepID=UPI001268191B|nr:DUF1129 family protein [Bacillus sp. THAF10]